MLDIKDTVWWDDNYRYGKLRIKEGRFLKIKSFYYDDGSKGTAKSG